MAPTIETELTDETELVRAAESVSSEWLTDETEWISETDSAGDVQPEDEMELTNETDSAGSVEQADETEWISETQLTDETASAGNAELKGDAVESVPYVITGPEFIKDGVCSIPEIFEQDGVNYKVVGIAPNAYENNKDITSLYIPDSITEVSDYAFAYCPNLSKIELGHGIEQFGYFVFVGCTSLREVVVPDNITEIYGCFGGCSSLSEVYLPHGIQLATIDFDDCTNLNTIHYNGTKREWENLCVSAPAPIMEVSIDRVFDASVNVIFQQ